MGQLPLDASDRRAVSAATLAAFLLIAQQVASRAVRDALFLSAFQVKSLPAVMAASALVAIAGAEVLAFALARRAPSRLVPAAAVVSTLLLAGWWAVGLHAPRLAAVLLYLHVAAFGGALVSGFWSMVNERFDPYTARRVVGRIGAGATAGGVAGGVLVLAVSRLLPAGAAVLLLVGLSAAACLVLLLGAGGSRQGSPPPSTPILALPLLARSPHLRNIVLVIALGAVVEALVDFLFKGLATARFAPGAPLLGAFAAFHATVSVASLLLQTATSRASLRHLGIAGTLALRPALTAAGSLVGVVLPGFASATLARGAHESLTNSLFRSAYELLYTPLPESEKRRVKAVVDVAVDKLGTLLGSGLAALAVSLLPHSWPVALAAAAAAVSLLALALSRRLHRGYVATLEQSLVAGRVRLDPDDAVDPATQTTLAHTSLMDRGTLLREIEALRGSPVPAAAAGAPAPPAPEDALARMLAGVRTGRPELVRRALRENPEPDALLVAALVPHLGDDDLFPEVLRALRRSAPRVTGQLLDVLLDGTGDPVVRRRVCRVLKASPNARAVEGLLTALDDPSFDVRAAAGTALAAIHERHALVRVDREELLDRVRRELDSGEPVDRQLGQLFALLSLALERGPLQIAWAAMRGTDRALKGTALEYLSNVLPSDVFPRVRSVLGASALPPPRAARPLEQLKDELRASSIGLRIEQPPWREGGEG
jgi:hypothetical protein